jgi:hypothetical protein
LIIADTIILNNTRSIVHEFKLHVASLSARPFALCENEIRQLTAKEPVAAEPKKQEDFLSVELKSLRMFHSRICETRLIKLRDFSVALGLVGLNALPAGAISHRLMQFSAMVANPSRWNGAGKAVLAIAEIGVHFFTFARQRTPMGILGGRGSIVFK